MTVDAEHDPVVPGASEPPTRPASPIAWAEVARWAVVGLLALVLLVLVDVHRYGGNNPVSLVQPGTQGSATALFARDFPDLEQPDGLGLDGQQYYAIARHPLHLDESASHLDYPRYRLQRPLLPWTAWLLHPTGGGVPLVGTLVLVTLVGVLIGALATGALSMTLGGPAWVAVAFPVLPGVYWSLRVTVADALALGLALAALALAARNRHGWAVAVACLAVLAKEPTILILLGWSIARRTRRDTLLTLVPGVVIAAWMAWLRVQLPPDPERTTQDIGLPFVGLYDAWTQIWSQGNEWVGMACTLGGLAVGLAALARRRFGHPLSWAIAGQLAFMVTMGLNPTAMNFGGTRMAMAVMILGLVALVTPNASEVLRAGTAPGRPGEPGEPGELVSPDSSDSSDSSVSSVSAPDPAPA